MRQNIIEAAHTASATTNDTEQEVVAAISSAEGGPDAPTAFRARGSAPGLGRPLLLLAAGAMLGYGAVRWLRQRG